jgi:predicted AlkP superfamily pyrophosphatase or phosphodiesterase
MAAGRHAYENLPQALAELRQAVLAEKGRAYYYMHWGMVDNVGHYSGPFADEALAALRFTLDTIESDLLNHLAAADNTLLLIGADHGQEAVDPARTIYLNQLLPDIAKVFRKTAAGRPIVPGGSARDFFLYIEDDDLEETRALLADRLAGAAQVLRVDELIEQGYFGRPVSEAFLARVGNLVILPNTGETVWWYEENRFAMPFKGHHGGLSANEMLTPLMALYG